MAEKHVAKEKRCAKGLQVAILLSLQVGCLVAFAGSSTRASWTDVAYRVAAEGTALLKNEQTALPVAPGSTFRCYSTPGKLEICGGGSAFVNVERKVDLPEMLEATGLKRVNSDADLGIVVISRSAAEGRDIERYRFNLSEDELGGVKEAGMDAKKVVVIVNAGHLVNLRPIKDNPAVNAILFCWFPGQEGAAALADIIVGKVNPSGRLADTLAESVYDYPSDRDFCAYSSNLPYSEGMDVGYRYFNAKAKESIVYPFGHGLSYTRFSESVVKTVSADEFRSTVKNEGDRPGRHSVLHFQKGELVAFGKSRLLNPGESEDVPLRPFVRKPVKRYPQETEPNDPEIDEILAKLTLEEKVGLCSAQPSAAPRGTGGIGNLPELGVPNPQTSDGPNGVRRSGTSTCYPSSSLLAQTFDEGLAYEVGRALGEEAKSWKVDILLGPSLNIHRHPLCGRNFEYFSEDPLLTGKMGASYVRGVQSTGVAATLKHFCCNSRELFRYAYSADVDNRTLREIYLKGFEIAVREGHPRCVMTAYNRVNGTPSGECGWLLNGILRGEWGFDGLVMTDWRAQSEIWRQIQAGCDVYMPYGYPEKVKLAIDKVKSGELAEKDVDACAKRVLREVKRSIRYREKDMGNIVPVAAKGETVVPAEKLSCVSSTWTLSETDPVEGWCHTGLGRDPKGNDTFVEYLLDVAAAGEYDVSILVRSSDSKATVSFEALGREGKSQGFAKLNAWQTMGPSRMSLPKGMVRIRVYVRNGSQRGYAIEPCVTLSKMRLVPVR